MGQIATESSLIASQSEVQGEIRKLVERLSLKQRSVLLTTSKVLAKLSASERHAAMNIIRRRDKHEGLDYRWFTSFLAVLSKLKAQESPSEAE